MRARFGAVRLSLCICSSVPEPAYIIHWPPRCQAAEHAEHATPHNTDTANRICHFLIIFMRAAKLEQKQR